MEQLREDFLEAKRELALQGYLRDVAETKTLELSRQIQILNAEISALKQQLDKDTREISTQTGEDHPTNFGSAHTAGSVPDHTAGSVPDQSTEDSLVAPDLLENGIESLAETLRQTAESAVEQSGYVMDAASGMYYDYKSGYYYDPNTCLLYDPHSGTYYTYNEDTQGYEFHSKVDLSQYSTPQSTQEDQELAWEAEKKARKKARRKENGRRRKEKKQLGAIAAEKSELLPSSSVKSKKHHRKRSRHKRKKQESNDRDKNHSHEKSVKNHLPVEKDGYIVISDDDMSPLSEEADRKNDLNDNGDGMELMELGNDDSETGAEGVSGKGGTATDEEVLQTGETGVVGMSAVEGVRGMARTDGSGKAAVKMEDIDVHDIENCDEQEDVRELGGTVTGERVDHRAVTRVGITKSDYRDEDHSDRKDVIPSKTEKDIPRTDGEGSEMEEGELLDSSGDSYEDISGDSCDGQGLTSSSGSSTSGEDSNSMEEEERVESPVNLLDFPPCVRFIVTDSESFQVGSLHIVTVLGGTIGREGVGHVVRIPELTVSKRHAEITYNEDKKCYAIRDLGSQNGTLLNPTAIAMGRVGSEPQDLAHKDVLQFGSTVFEVHIHQGNWTCPGCEPGVVQAKLSTENDRNIHQVSAPASRAGKEALRRKELKKIKKKYDLVGDAYKVDGPTLKGQYVDRAERRRQVVGSDNPHQKDDAPSSVNRAIDESNKGHQMLLKMGWKEGESLGTGDQGIREPIQVGLRSTKAGLGSCPAMPMDMALNRTKKISFAWNKSRERLAQSDPLYAGAEFPEPKYTLWVQGRTVIMGEQEPGEGEGTRGRETDAATGEELRDATSTDGGGHHEKSEDSGNSTLASCSKQKVMGNIDMFE